MDLTIKVILTYKVGGSLLVNRSNKMITGYGENGFYRKNVEIGELEEKESYVNWKISNYAYKSMTSDIAPSEFTHFRKKKEWSKMSSEARLQYYMVQLAKGNPFSYHILD